MTAWRFDPHSSMPLHAQLEGHIKQQISVGHWLPGSRIPSERELMQLTGLSRATIRQTLMSLVHQNVLHKVHGSGTFVAHPKYEQALDTVYSFSEQFRQLGQSLKDTVIKQAVEHADEVLAARMAIPPGSEVIVIGRLRVVQDRPMMVNMAYVPLALCPWLATEPITGSLYRLLSEHYGLTVTRATDKLEAISASKELAALLSIRPAAPLMFVERTAYTTENRILHLGENHIRGDMCRFSINLNGGQMTTLELKSTQPD
jgi:GntR family transcriptional regulator